MTVRIGIAADASDTVSAIRMIQTELRRAGQAGRELSQLDLSHPELTGVANDLAQVHQNLENLQKLGRGETAAFARRHGPAITSLDPQQLQAAAGAAYPNEATRQRVLGNTGRYIFGGTQWGPAGSAAPSGPVTHPPAGVAPPSGGGGGIAPPAGPPPGGSPPPAPPAPPSGGGGGGGGAGGGGGGGLNWHRTPDPLQGMGSQVLSRFSGGMRAGIAGALGAAGVAGVAALTATAVGNARDEAVANNDLFRVLGDSSQDFETLRDRVRQAAEGLGITYQEAQRLTHSFVTLSSTSNNLEASEAVRFAAGVGRGVGVDGATMVHGVGRAAFFGQNPKEMAALMVQAMRDGNMTGRGGEVLDALTRFTETSARSLATSSDPTQFARMYAALSSSTPGLRGAGASELLQTINGSLQGGGSAGDASQFLTAMAFARHGVTDPYRQQMIREGGMFEQLPDGTSVLGATMGEIHARYGGNSQEQRDRRAHVIGRHFGISGRKAAAFDRVYSTWGQEGMRTGSEGLRERGIDLNEVAPEALGDIMQAQVGSDEQIKAMRDRYLASRDSRFDPYREGLRGKEGQELRDALLEMLRKTGMERNSGTETTESINNLNNQLTRNGQAMLSTVNATRDILAKSLEKTADIADFLRMSYMARFGTPEQRAAATTYLDEQHSRRYGAVDDEVRRMEVEATTGNGGPGTAQVPRSGEQSERARQVYDRLRAGGLGHAQAVAFVANGMHESGLDPSRTNPGDGRDGSDSVGLLHWNADRAQNFRRFLGGRDPAKATWQESVDFFLHEHRNDPGESRRTGAFLGAETAGQAAAAMSRDMVRPGKREENMRNRARTAQAIERQLFPDGPPAAPGRAERSLALPAPPPEAPPLPYAPLRDEPTGEEPLPVPGRRRVPRAAMRVDEPEGEEPLPIPGFRPAPERQDGGGGAGAQDVRHRIEPLEVIERGRDGAIRSVQHLPVQRLGPATSYGRA